jgi:CRISPR/Cas system CSM-associated protein Csm4 (group 5 of RAMP superfamily)
MTENYRSQLGFGMFSITKKERKKKEVRKASTYICFSSGIYVSQCKESTTKYYNVLHLAGEGRVPLDCLIKEVTF